MPKPTYRLVTPLVMWIIVIVGIILSYLFVPAGNLFERDALGNVVLLAGLVYWLYVFLLALQIHPQAHRGVHAISEVIAEGPYAVVRHPMYASDIILAWCVFVWYPTYQVLAIAIWLSGVLLFWSALEEWLLEEKFLEKYRAYKRRVPMFVPRFRKRKAI